MLYEVSYCLGLKTKVVWVYLLHTEAEYIALSHSMRELIPFTGLVEELNEIFNKDKLKPIEKCKLFEDNNGAL